MTTAGLVRLCAVCAIAVGSASARAQEQTAYLAFSAGAFDLFREEHRATQFGVQYRTAQQVWILQPMIGANVTDDDSAYVYVGVSLDLSIGERLVLRPSFAPGYYHKGEGKDLEGALQFRTGVELAYRFDGGYRLGVELSHRSNAGLHDRNPGEESLMAFFHVPFPGP